MPQGAANLSASDFYGVLGLSRGATADDIRKAFRSLAGKWHPDRNSDELAVARFQALTQAYAVLGDPRRRAKYDAATPLKGEPSAATKPASRPICCTDCGAITAQPRILRFRTTLGLGVWSLNRSIEGVYCSRCGRAAGLRASAFSALGGWWSVPLGPILTIRCILVNALGGERRPAADARLVLFNARAFLTVNPALAHALAILARDQADADREEATRIMALALAHGAPRRRITLKDPWRMSMRCVLQHLLLLSAGPALAAGLVILVT